MDQKAVKAFYPHCAATCRIRAQVTPVTKSSPSSCPIFVNQHDPYFFSHRFFLFILKAIGSRGSIGTLSERRKTLQDMNLRSQSLEAPYPYTYGATQPNPDPDTCSSLSLHAAAASSDSHTESSGIEGNRLFFVPICGLYKCCRLLINQDKDVGQ